MICRSVVQGPVYKDQHPKLQMADRPEHPIAHRDPKRSIDDVISRGRSWNGVPDEYLVGHTIEAGGTDAADQTPAVIEMQRRLKVAIEHSDETSQRQIEALIGVSAVAGEQSTKLVTLSEQSATETEHMSRLTERIEHLNSAVLWLTVVTAVFGGIQAAAVLVHVYRWYRGWL
jgi:hypothetical protein